MKKLLLATVFASAISLVTAAPINETSDQGYYTAAAATDCAPVTVTFDQIVNFPGATTVRYHWMDGTGTSTIMALSATPTHTFNNAGTFDVLCEYFNSIGNNVGWEYNRIELFGNPSGVYSQQTSACPNDLVYFYVPMGWSQSSVNTYTWNFGDGVTETSSWQDASHAYASAGTYNVSVTVNGPCGTYNENFNFTVGTNVPFSGAWFYNNASYQGSCPNEQVYFGFPNSYANYLLTFGDGQFTNNEYYHTYTSAGTYPVSITLTNGCGNSGTYYDTVYIVNNLGFNPNQQIYVYNSSPVCPGQEVHFDTYSSYMQSIWSFSDGSTDTGYYTKHDINSLVDDTAYVTIINGCGADTTVMTIVDVVTNLPVTEINLTATDSVCTGSYFPYLANGGSELETDYIYEWDFGDGNTSTSPNGTHSFANNGTYTISLHITNGCGNDSTETQQIYVGPGVAPDPNSQLLFMADEDGACPGDTVLLVIFPYVPGQYLVDFGDGFTTNAVYTVELMGSLYGAVKHAYAASGNYNMSLTYTNSCGLSYTKNGTMTVSSGNQANTNGLFYDESLSICLGEPITFYSYGGNEYQWNFGDGSGSLTTYNTFQPMDHVYENPGVYTVTLQLTNGCGNSAVITESVVVPDNHIDIVTNTVDATCGEADGKAIAVINGGNAPYNIYWSNGSTGILVDSLASGIYVVNVTDQNECYNFGIATVSDAQAPAIVLNTVVDVTCNGGNDGALDINVIGSTGPYTFEWSNGATTEDQSGLVAGPYEVHVTDANGCIAVASFSVGEPEEVQVSFDITNPSYMQGSCNIANGIVTAQALGNSGPFTYVWNNGHNGSTLAGVTSGIYTVNVIDQVGCIITEQVAVSANNGLGGPVITTNSVSPLNCSGGGSNIDVSVYFASGTTTYSWSTGATTEDVNVTQEGTYTLTVTDALGCQAFEIFEIDNAAPSPLNICMVTVDSVFNTNRIVFDKPFSTDIEYFKIYRESSQAGLYYHIGNVHYDSLSLFVDGVANPMVQAWRYKISAVDFCGEESALSPAHKTIHLNQNLGLVPGSVNLIWDHYDGFAYSTYEIVRYTASAGWQVIASVSAQNTSYTDPAAPLSDSTLFYVVTADPPSSCVATRAQNNGTTRSNRTDNPMSLTVSGITTTNKPVQNFNIYPNPNDGMFTIEMSVNEGGYYTVEITDMVGQVVETFQTGHTSSFYRKNVDLRSLSTGVYFVKIGNKNGYLTKKLVKN